MSSDTERSFASLSSDCPAFAQGCPYKDPHGDEKARELVKKCPAFEKGCPFKAAGNLGNLGQLLQTLPETHKVGGELYGSVRALKEILIAIHERSMEVKKNLGECPVFSTSCPLKNLTSSGTPLVSELEYRTWRVFAEADKAAAPDDDDHDDVELSKQLKTGTKKSHRAAEQVHFIRNFIKGKIDKQLYKHMVVFLWHVYSALEDELRKNHTNSVYSKLHFPKELERTQTLEQDLEYYLGPEWRQSKEVKNSPSPCTKDYVDRIRKVGKEQPELLVAHAYTRYLGDLSGGQILAKVAKKAMQLPADGKGTAFYQFEHVPNARAFKNHYRMRLDATEVSPSMADLLVAEANLAFVLNMRVFEELDVMAGDASQVRSLQEVLATLEMPVRENEKCPFASLGAKAGFSAHNTSTTQPAVAQGECPFPFILLHDPVKGLKNPKAWLLALLVLVFAILYR